MVFRPKANDTLIIGGTTYHFAEHPDAEGMGIPYAKMGRLAAVYQLARPDSSLHALKVFAQAYRTPRIAKNAECLRPLAALEALQVCNRLVLTPERHPMLLAQHPDLAYAALMPWVAGSTWQEIVLGRQPLSPEQSRSVAQALSSALATMEAQGLAHCDLSGPNVLVAIDPTKVALVDVEDIYAPGLPRPEKLASGSPGYAHRTASYRLWTPQADYFAGAVLLSEMLAWCDPRVREMAQGEQFFHPEEMQNPSSERFRLLRTVLRERVGAPIADAFSRAWESPTLEHCPAMAEWARLLDVSPQDIPVDLTILQKACIATPAAPVTALPVGPIQPELPLVGGAPDTPDTGLDAAGGSTERAREESLSRLFDAGLEAYQLGAWAQAREYLTEAVRQQPNYMRAGVYASVLLNEAMRQLSLLNRRTPVRRMAVATLVLGVLCGIAASLLWVTIEAYPASGPTPTATVHPTYTATSTLQPTPTNAVIKTPAPGPGRYLYGPVDGELVAGDNDIPEKRVDLHQSNFVAQVRFYNPDPGSYNGWDYGFSFPSSDIGSHYRLMIFQSRIWSFHRLYFENGEWKHQPGKEGQIEHLNTGYGGHNDLQVIVLGDKVYFWVNGRYVDTLDISYRGADLDVAIAARSATGNAPVIRFEAFTVWEPQSYKVPDGELRETDGSLPTRQIGVSLVNFMLAVQFYNPSSSSEHTWDYGLLFRGSARGESYRLSIKSDGSWALKLAQERDGKLSSEPVDKGSIDNLNIFGGESNELRLVVMGDTALLYVNGKYIATLNVSEKVTQGYVAIAKDLSVRETLVPSLRYEDYVVWSLPESGAK